MCAHACRGVEITVFHSIPPRAGSSVACFLTSRAQSGARGLADPSAPPLVGCISTLPPPPPPSPPPISFSPNVGLFDLDLEPT